ncbi:PREDICTED: mitochondrial import inner membrane translocase subunit Tim9-like [Acropora digitifera]|uniref:mitochondrial import inner membrane translocase subunit Tim9-like n=1 Tax=Acropora digitifera TaxID=70779 RepID=UPI00077B1665|nr:PREDICTED: mitochondrial import inner membrane translocase subunit Tim9-like [Acropora digitifera]
MQASITPSQQQEMEVKQFQNFLQYYNKLTEMCFSDCIHDFTNRKISASENNCAMHCSEKFLKVMQRVGVRLQEVQFMQNEGILGSPDPPK